MRELPQDGVGAIDSYRGRGKAWRRGTCCRRSSARRSRKTKKPDIVLSGRRPKHRINGPGRTGRDRQALAAHSSQSGNDSWKSHPMPSFAPVGGTKHVVELDRGKNVVRVVGVDYHVVRGARACRLRRSSQKPSSDSASSCYRRRSISTVPGWPGWSREKMASAPIEAAGAGHRGANRCGGLFESITSLAKPTRSKVPGATCVQFPAPRSSDTKKPLSVIRVAAVALAGANENPGRVEIGIKGNRADRQRRLALENGR